ncbi:RNA transcription, translation and transport factor protein-like [Tigriopus californicus]|uniref:RNA transcription, translation and transport factor protein-like n=1 Tax=Tigriopus californicus TaxID=6832 RepID=UPI0027DA64D1|nr:RNA transcription, translation and transport factor protein-like [Tigriopus californicus]
MSLTGLTPLFRARLSVLGHPNCNQFNAEDVSQYRHVVAWLEDQKIRFYPIQDRDPLRRVQAPDWDSHCQTYVERMQCPASLARRNAQTRLMWLLNRAVQLQYAQNNPPHQHDKEEINGAEAKSTNPLSGIDVKGDEFKSQVAQLAKELKVTPHPDPVITFEACCIVIKALVDKRDNESPSKSKEKVQRLDLNAHNFGVSQELQKEPGLCRALKVLRLLNLKDLRGLQDEVNNTIEQIQALTANPKTDTRLGQVGR